MPKKTIQKYYRRKGRWSANIKTLVESEVPVLANSPFFATSDLATNPAQSESTISQTYTVKNVEVTFELSLNTANDQIPYIESLIAYIMYVPQGMTVSETYPNSHPEYIMNYRFVGSPDYDNSNTAYRTLPIKIKTRLARRLQTGDKLILLVTGMNGSQYTNPLRFNGIIRWWTKAN